MSSPDLLVALDQGTSSTKAILLNQRHEILRAASAPVACRYPQPGWVEQDPELIWESVVQAVRDVLTGTDPGRVVGVCLSTQRESLILWDPTNGRPAHPMLSWQDQRTTDACDWLVSQGHSPAVRAATGLPLDPMFSGTKATWLLDQADPSRHKSRLGKLVLGTVDAWLLYKLTGRHLTEPGNASRTQLLNLSTLAWDPNMLNLFEVPAQALPEITGSAGPFPPVKGCPPLRDGTPVLAVLADSHAALFAHGAWQPGHVKATYGTGSSVMGVTPPSTNPPKEVALTVAWQHQGPTLALEGNITSSGATLAWLGRTVGQSPSELASLAAGVTGSDGVVIVPAFSGLGAPWWDPHTRGLICGLSFGTGPAQLARAALESVAAQVRDVLREIERHSGPVDLILADGGASSNPDLMQLQADIAGVPVQVADRADMSALGAAYLGGVTAELWTLDELRQLPREGRSFQPHWSADQRAEFDSQWLDAVALAREPRTRPNAAVGSR